MMGFMSTHSFYVNTPPASVNNLVSQTLKLQQYIGKVQKYYKYLNSFLSSSVTLAWSTVRLVKYENYVISCTNTMTENKQAHF